MATGSLHPHPLPCTLLSVADQVVPPGCRDAHSEADGLETTVVTRGG